MAKKRDRHDYNAAYWKKTKTKQTAAHKKWVAKNRAYLKAYYKEIDSTPARKDRKRQHMSGWTREEFELAWEQQCGKCAICDRPLTKEGRHAKDIAHADHRHNDMTPRALLCPQHNVGIGFFQDSPELLRRAALYLETDHRALRDEYARTQVRAT